MACKGNDVQQLRGGDIVRERTKIERVHRTVHLTEAADLELHDMRTRKECVTGRIVSLGEIVSEAIIKMSKEVIK
jgi:hypothetical protein